MTGYMGYDPERLAGLRQAMGFATDDLVRLRCDDPAAATAMSVLRTARATLVDGWLPFLEQLLLCGVLDGYTPARLDGTDVRDASMLARQTDGWKVVTDPMTLEAAANPMSEADAAALAEILRDGDPAELCDTPAELEWLASRLDAIAAAPELRVAFEAVLAPASTRWTELCDSLSLVRLRDDDDDDGAVDAVFASVARLHPDWEQTESLLAEMEPYSAALLITNLDLPRDALVSAVYAVMLRWWTGPEDGGRQWCDEAPWGDQTADILFRHLAAQPDAATAFLVLATEHPGLVFETADDQNNVLAVLTAGSAPSRVDPATAGTIIVPLMRFVAFYADRAGRIGTFGPTLFELGASLSMPWLLHFGKRAPEWGWTEGEAAEALATVITHGDALIIVADMLRSVTNEISGIPLVVDGVPNAAAMLVASESYWDILEMLETQEIAFGDDMRLFFDLLIEVGNMALGFVPLSTATKLVADQGIPVVVDLLEQWKVIPPDTEEVREVAHRTMEQRAVECAASVVAIVVIQLVEQGILPAASRDGLTFEDLEGECMPSLAYARLSDYVFQLPLDPRTAGAVWGVLNAFFNSATARLLCRAE